MDDQYPDAIGSGRRGFGAPPVEAPVDPVLEAIKRGIQQAAAEESEACVKEAVADFERRLRERIALGAMEVSKHYEVHRDAHRIVIEVKT